MSGETDLDKLLSLMQPRLIEGEYVFCSVPDSKYGDFTELKPLASFQEAEGLSCFSIGTRLITRGFDMTRFLKVSAYQFTQTSMP